MKLSIVLIVAAKIVSASRLDFFKKHHHRPAPVTKKQNQLLAIRQQLCNAQTCQKCAQVFIYGDNYSMKTMCRLVMKIKGCCPAQLFVRSRF